MYKLGGGLENIGWNHIHTGNWETTFFFNHKCRIFHHKKNEDFSSQLSCRR